MYGRNEDFLHPSKLYLNVIQRNKNLSELKALTIQPKRNSLNWRQKQIIQVEL